MRYFLSIGSNLGDRGRNLSHALYLLKEEGVKILKLSSIYETQPVDCPSFPWFYNQVVEVSANFDPEAFLTLIKEIEHKMGRSFTSQKSPRTIDLDILLAENTIIQTEQIRIPHPRMEKRNFVLIPFMEISAETIHPILRENIRNIWKKSNDTSIVKQIKNDEMQ